MITPNDIDYKETKAVISGEKKSSEKVEQLKEWIEVEYGIKVLHVVQDHLDTLNKPRLNVVLENYSDVEKFNDKNYNYDSLKQSMISCKFSEINGKENKKNLFKEIFKKPKDNYFVCFSAFIPIAKSEIIQSVPDKVMFDFIDRNLTEKVWKIHDTQLVFVYKESDIETYEKSIEFENLKDDFIRTIKPYDHNEYFKRDELNFGVDSKENFDNNYESSWFYYYK